MGKVKCSKCGKLAEVSLKGEMYCWGCIPKIEAPVTVEETLVNEMVIEKMERPKPDKEDFLPWDMESDKVVEKDPWWKKFWGNIKSFLDEGPYHR